MLNFVAIDFETANAKRNSVCSLGITVVNNNKIIGGKSWLIRPKEMDFSPINIKINGIHPEQVIDKPEFPEIWGKINRFFESNYIVSHNAAFDMSVLRNVLYEYSLECPNLNYFCSVELSKKKWPELPNHKLSTVTGFLQIPLTHHQAGSDSLACAKIVLTIAKAFETNSLDAIFAQLEYCPKKLLDVPISSFAKTAKNKVLPAKTSKKKTANKKTSRKVTKKELKEIMATLKAKEIVSLIQTAYQEGKTTAYQERKSTGGRIEANAQPHYDIVPPMFSHIEFSIIVFFGVLFILWVFWLFF